MADSLLISVQGVAAGVLVDHGSHTTFALTDAYRERSDRPVLGQIFEDQPAKVWRRNNRVPPWFANLLPEDQMRAVLARHLEVSSERDAPLLAALGGPGGGRHRNGPRRTASERRGRRCDRRHARGRARWWHQVLHRRGSTEAVDGPARPAPDLGWQGRARWEDREAAHRWPSRRASERTRLDVVGAPDGRGHPADRPRLHGRPRDP